MTAHAGYVRGGEWAGAQKEDTAWGWVLAATITGALLVVLYGFLTSSPTPPPAPALALSAVKMEAPQWTGSGVYLGNGYIITAGHVTDGLQSIDIELSTGAKTKGTVLWANTPEVGGYDVSLVYAPNLQATAAPLSCKPTFVGEDVTIVGNPLTLTFLETWGKVSGAIQPGQWSSWKSLVALDIVAAPGVSGGPVYSKGGEVVGILVSGLISDRGTFGYSMMVPSTTICQLLAR